MSNFLYGLGLMFLIGVIGVIYVFMGIKIYEYHGWFATYLYVLGTVSVFILHRRRSNTTD